jgi:hypothetical protein
LWPTFYLRLICEEKNPPSYHQHLDDRRRGVLDPQDRQQRLGLKGFWVGGFLSFFLAIGAPYSNMILRSTLMATDFSTPGAIFLFLVLIGLLNVLFKVAALSRSSP